MNLRKYGELIELQANEILKENFERIEWIIFRRNLNNQKVDEVFR